MATHTQPARRRPLHTFLVFLVASMALLGSMAGVVCGVMRAPAANRAAPSTSLLVDTVVERQAGRAADTEPPDSLDVAAPEPQATSDQSSTQTAGAAGQIAAEPQTTAHDERTESPTDPKPSDIRFAPPETAHARAAPRQAESGVRRIEGELMVTQGAGRIVFARGRRTIDRLRGRALEVGFRTRPDTDWLLVVPFRDVGFAYRERLDDNWFRLVGVGRNAWVRFNEPLATAVNTALAHGDTATVEDTGELSIAPPSRSTR